jgi:hypothetical protein
MHPPFSACTGVDVDPPQVMLVGEKSMLVVDPASVTVPLKLTKPFKAGNEPVTVPSNVSDIFGLMLMGIEPVIGDPPDDGFIVKSIASFAAASPDALTDRL